MDAAAANNLRIDNRLIIDLKVTELRDLLGDRGLSKVGVKATLVARLQEVRRFLSS
jgi:hypothetical protein